MTKKEQRYLLDLYQATLHKATKYTLQANENKDVAKLAEFYHGQASGYRHALEDLSGKFAVYNQKTNRYELEDEDIC